MRMQKNHVIVLVALATGLYVGSWIERVAPEKRVHAQAAWSARKFYLSKGVAQGDQVLKACATGYHAASIWEIFYVSGLQYDTALGVVSDDSGAGPPATATGVLAGAGWVRTGNLSLSGPNPGSNCKAWTSKAKTDWGSAVKLAGVWRGIDPASQTVNPWFNILVNDQPPTCDAQLRVWCVQD